MIYFVRHGQTDWNIEGRYQGQTDIELNQTGIEQAEELMDKLKSINFDIVISSPLKRAYKTAEIIRNGTIFTDNRLMERSKGQLEGTLNKRIKEVVDLTNPKHEIQFEIEPLATFRKRIFEFWDETLEKHSGKNILVVTHTGVARYTQCYFKGEPENGDYKQYDIKNCEILQLENK